MSNLLEARIKRIQDNMWFSQISYIVYTVSGMSVTLLLQSVSPMMVITQQSWKTLHVFTKQKEVKLAVFYNRFCFPGSRVPTQKHDSQGVRSKDVLRELMI